MKLRVRVIDPRAVVPQRAHEGDAGYDLTAIAARSSNGALITDRDGYIVDPHEVVRFATGIAADVGPDAVGVVMDRSSVAQRGLVVVGGVVDSGYRGEVHVLLLNAGASAQWVRLGTRVAQLVLLPVLTPEVEVVEDLGETDRGTQGFGSSGA